MTVTVAATSNTNTVEYLINRTNELANAISTVAVTTNSNTAVGNAAVTGTFTANVLVANTVRISNSSSNVVISVPNSSIISSGNYFLNASGDWTQVSSPITTGTVQTSGTGSQIVDSYLTSSVNAAEYFIHIKNNLANGYQSSKVLTLHNGSTGSPTPNAYSTEYAVLTSNGTVGTFTATSNGSHMILSVTPVFSNTTINFTRVQF